MRRCTYLLATTAGLLAFGACTHGKPDPNAAAFAAVASGTGDDFKAALHDNTKLFQSGPQQIPGPDAFLKKGTLVRMVRHQFGYSLVQTVATSQLGWVANDDLGPASPTDSANQAGFPDNGLAPSGAVESNPAAPTNRAPARTSASPQPTPQP
jgi:hypothetical protein